ncbi:MAG: single-stranded DNA-binding protein [Chlamydiales bacterium]|nr:single-stranded DNA-binding protein [Chlamydiales bacterium]
MNKITIAGHLGADPETRFTSTGKKVTTLRVATRTRKGAQDDTIWWRVTLWDDQFDKMLPYLKKGSAIIVYGDVLKPEIFQDKEGKPQISMEIRAVDIQFSPFGKPEGRSGAADHHATGTSSASPFGTSHDSSPANPYIGGYSPAGAGMDAFAKSSPIGASQGHSFDDEVPF